MNSDTRGPESPLKQALVALDRMEARLREAERGRREPIAIVGMACRFPGAPDVDAFWKLLCDGVESVKPVPADRWDIDRWFHPDPDRLGTMSTRTGGFLEGVDRFDAPFFRISPREAASMDPQQRLWLEVAWEAFEDAGIPPSSLAGTPAGVFVGITLNDYSQIIRSGGAAGLDSYYATGNCLNVTAGRLSYFLGLQGPSLAVDTACSSSLVSVHLACQSLRLGECDIAVAGGVNLILSPEMTVAMSRNHTMAPDGHCKPFSAAADGYVRGEGCGVVVLTRQSLAAERGYRVLASIRGSAVMHGGKASGLTVPNRRSQELLLRKALDSAGVRPEEVGFVEAHGTGTSLGDPIEMRALGAILREGRRPDAPCFVGSLKANVGHLESASGAAGLIKSVLVLKHGVIPGQLHCEEINPDIPLEELRLSVPTSMTKWPDGAPRTAGVSSFGFSGTIAHVVVSAPVPVRATPSQVPPGTRVLVPLSARTDAALRQMAERCANKVQSEGEWSIVDIAHTASLRRTHFDRRIAVAAADTAELAEALMSFGAGGNHPAVVEPRGGSGAPVFVFSGQGSQFPGMASGFLGEPVFRDALVACSDVLKHLNGWSLFDRIKTGDGPWFDEIEFVQPALFAIQVALAAMWRSWGIEPAAVIGHSMGEVAAAHVAGRLSLDDACRIIHARSCQLSLIRGSGAMALLDVEEAAALELIEPVRDRVSIAAVNGETSIVISGETGAVADVLSRTEAAGIFCRRVNVDVASHSPQVEPLLAGLLDQVAGVTPRAGTTPFISTITGDVFDGDLDAGYWVRNVRNPVRFRNALEAAARLGHNVFVELSPHPVLTTSIEKPGSGPVRHALPSLRRDESERDVMLLSLAHLFVSGAGVHWDAVNPPGALVGLPPYPFERERHWTTAPDAHVGAGALSHPLLGVRRTARLTEFEFENRYSAGAPAFLADHVIYGNVVVPGTSHVVLMAAAAADAVGGDGCRIEDICFPAALRLTGDESRRIHCRLKARDGGGADIEVSSSAITGGDRIVHATARVQSSAAMPGPAAGDLLGQMRDRGMVAVDAAGFYQDLWSVGYELGPAFRWISDLWTSDSEAVARLAVPRGIVPVVQDGIDPGLLDSCFQAICAAMPGGTSELVRRGEVFAPFAVESIELWPVGAGELWCHVRATSLTPEIIEGDLDVYTPTGRCVIRIRGLRLKRAARSLLGVRRDELSSGMFGWEWKPVPSREQDVLSGVWVVVPDRTGVADSVVRGIEAAGGRVLRIELDGKQPALLNGSGPAHRIAGVLMLRGLDYRKGHHEESGVRDLPELAVETLRLVQSLVEHPLPGQPRLWLVTSGVHQVSEFESGDPRSSILWGFGPVVASEHPELGCTRVDLDSGNCDELAEALLVELRSADAEDQIAVRQGQRFAARMTALDTRGGFEFTAGRPVELDTEGRGVLDNLALRPVSRRPPGPGEVEIETATTTLNLRDVLNALGRGYPSGWPFGFECSGRIVSLGAGVTQLSVGDEVIAFTPSSFRSFVTTRAEFVAKRPSSLPLAEAATLWAPFTTALYALRDIARVQAGQRVLIHAAAGGTGLALVQVALHLGCEVYGTASPSKWGVLRAMGVQHVMNSRTVEFAAQIREATGGEGVDVAVNSLADEFIEATLGVVRRNGSFLEMGKTGRWESAAVAAVRPDIAYTQFNLVDLSLKDPSLAARLIEDVLAAVSEGWLKPLPASVFAVARTVEAFRHMAQARHVGRVIVSWNGAEAPPDAGRIRPDGAYLLTGGTGALGLQVAQWLAERGAGTLVLASRRPASESAAAQIEQLRARGVRVEVRRVNVADPAEVVSLIGEFGLTLPRLSGVVHAAGVLDDATLLNMSDAQIHNVFDPKVAGAWNLHLATRHLELESFVMFSGAAGWLALQGQANYAAANAFLDALAVYRRSQGLPGTSVVWGPWSEVGLAAARSDRGQRLNDRGIGSLSPAHALHFLERLLERDVPVAAVVPLDVPAWKRHFPAQSRMPFFTDIAGGAVTGPATLPFSEVLRREEPRRRRERLQQFLGEQASRVLRIKTGRVEPATPFHTLGFDSLMGLEYRNRLEAEFGIRLPATLVWNHPTVAALSDFIAGQIQIPIDAAGPGDGLDRKGTTVAVSPPLTASDALDLSDDEAALLLRQPRTGLGRTAP